MDHPQGHQSTAGCRQDPQRFRARLHSCQRHWLSDLEANNFDYAAVKAKGLQRTEGKEYVVNDGDVIEFLFNV